MQHTIIEGPALKQDCLLEEENLRVRSWFEGLGSEICRTIENVEATHLTGPRARGPASRFVRTETKRASSDGSDAGGGLMSVLRHGRVFEKVGVNTSTVYGRLEPEQRMSLTARRSIPGLAADPRFWASGISIVAHLQNPRVPAVHFNTRMFWTPAASWFGGGTDLNPCLEIPEDTEFFHGVLKRCCDLHNPLYYPRFKDWADRYFWVRHRNRPRGVGGIFFDDLHSGDWEADFAFIRDVGKAFSNAYFPIVERRRNESWTNDDREAQLVHRGIYAEFNLVYDRGTKFGLETGHDPSAVLMSLPPTAKWP